MFGIKYTEKAKEQLIVLRDGKSLQKRFKAVVKAIKYLQNNPRHPSLNTHEFYSLKGFSDKRIFEAYAENHTPAAYRIFWYYGPDKQEITIVAITPHP